MSNKYGNGRLSRAQKGEVFRLEKKVRRLQMSVNRLKHLVYLEREKNKIFIEMLRGAQRDSKA